VRFARLSGFLPEIKRAESPIELPGICPIGLPAVQPEPLSCAAMKRVSIRVAELEFDMLVIGLHRSGTDAEFFRDAAGAEAGATQGKDMQLTVGQVGRVKMRCRMLGYLVNGKQRHRRTDIEFTCRNCFDGMNLLLP